jgi:hypothetical protein
MDCYSGKIISVLEKKDALWWYNERVSVGGFAGAVWRSGGIVLEEYSTHKLGSNGVAIKTAKTVIGRGDMDFMLGGKQFTMEAKQCWSRANIRKIKDKLKQAEEDLGRSIGERVQLAVVFAPLSLMSSSIEFDITKWIGQARDLKDCARAWVFPDHKRKLKGDNNRCYPGVGIFVKQVNK